MLRGAGSLLLSCISVSVHGHAAAAANLHIVFGAKTVPHPDKVWKGGEDAFYFDDSTGTFGVADGVGGSARGGVDPGEFSREILRRCLAATRKETTDGCVDLLHSLRAAAEPKLTTGGSSTLLLGQLDERTNAVRLLNLGDSGAMLLRPSFRRFSSGKRLWPRTVLRSVDQTHFFNCPYQVSCDSFHVAADHADQIFAIAQEGDILLAATDGVLDNLFDTTLQEAVAEWLPRLRGAEPIDAQRALDGLANAIATQANAIGMRQDEMGLPTPFEKAAAEEGHRFLGGKLDDVAVVCGVVRKGERPPLRTQHNFGDDDEIDTAVESGSGKVVPTAPSVQKSKQ